MKVSAPYEGPALGLELRTLWEVGHQGWHRRVGVLPRQCGLDPSQSPGCRRGPQGNVGSEVTSRTPLVGTG